MEKDNTERKNTKLQWTTDWSKLCFFLLCFFFDLREERKLLENTKNSFKAP